MIGIAPTALLVILSLVTLVTDLRWRRIPSSVTFPAMVAGLAIGALESLPGAPFQGGLIDHAAGLVVAFAFVYPLYLIRGMGGGDAKFLMAVGSLGGLSFFFHAAIYGSLIGGLLAVVLLALKRLDPPETHQPGRIRHFLKSRVPYGVALAAGVFVALGLAP